MVNKYDPAEYIRREHLTPIKPAPKPQKQGLLNRILSTFSRLWGSSQGEKVKTPPAEAPTPAKAKTRSWTERFFSLFKGSSKSLPKPPTKRTILLNSFFPRELPLLKTVTVASIASKQPSFAPMRPMADDPILALFRKHRLAFDSKQPPHVEVRTQIIHLDLTAPQPSLVSSEPEQKRKRAEKPVEMPVNVQPEVKEREVLPKVPEAVPEQPAKAIPAVPGVAEIIERPLAVQVEVVEQVKNESLTLLPGPQQKQLAKKQAEKEEQVAKPADQTQVKKKKGKRVSFAAEDQINQIREFQSVTGNIDPHMQDLVQYIDVSKENFADLSDLDQKLAQMIMGSVDKRKTFIKLWRNSNVILKKITLEQRQNFQKELKDWIINVKEEMIAKIKTVELEELQKIRNDVAYYLQHRATNIHNALNGKNYTELSSSDKQIVDFIIETEREAFEDFVRLASISGIKAVSDLKLQAKTKARIDKAITQKRSEIAQREIKAASSQAEAGLQKATEKLAATEVSKDEESTVSSREQVNFSSLRASKQKELMKKAVEDFVEYGQEEYFNEFASEIPAALSQEQRKLLTISCLMEKLFNETNKDKKLDRNTIVISEAVVTEIEQVIQAEKSS